MTRLPSCSVSAIREGIKIDQLAKDGKRDFHRFPIARFKGGEYQFSFSGVKTSVALYLKDKDDAFKQQDLGDICASFQECVVEMLITPTLNAALDHGSQDDSRRWWGRRQFPSARGVSTTSVTAWHHGLLPGISLLHRQCRDDCVSGVFPTAKRVNAPNTISQRPPICRWLDYSLRGQRHSILTA